MDESLREYLDRLIEFWQDFEPTTEAETAVQVDIPMLIERIEQAYELIHQARNDGQQIGFDAARKIYERKEAR